MVIKRAHVSEKSSNLAGQPDRPVYTFLVSSAANKPAVRRAVVETYKVTPRKINIGRRAGVKKAMVYLKSGDKIEFA